MRSPHTQMSNLQIAAFTNMTLRVDVTASERFTVSRREGKTAVVSRGGNRAPCEQYLARKAASSIHPVPECPQVPPKLTLTAVFG